MCNPGHGRGHTSFGKWTGAGVEGGALGPSGIPEPPGGSPVDLVSPVECCRIEAKVDGQPVRALLDTGSTVTIIHPKFLTRRVLQTARFPLVTVMGEKATLMGHCEAEILVEGHSTVMWVWAAEIPECCLLGIDFLHQAAAVLDLRAATLTLAGKCSVPIYFNSIWPGPQSRYLGHPNPSSQAQGVHGPSSSALSLTLQSVKTPFSGSAIGLSTLLPPAGTERHFILRRRRTDKLLGRWLSRVGLVCQGNFGHRRCRREPTPQSAFIATSSSAWAWCVPALDDEFVDGWMIINRVHTGWSLFHIGTYETDINATVFVRPVVNVKGEAPVAGYLSATLVSCFASNALPAAAVTWRFGDMENSLRTETNHTVHANGTITVVSYILGVPIKNLNEKNVQCVVKHNTLREDLVLNYTINIHYPPGSVVIIPDSPTNAKEFQCKVDSNPEPTNYIWTRVNKSVHEGNKLPVPKLSPDFNGLYICQASNQYGSSSGSLYVNVYTESSTVCWGLFGFFIIFALVAVAGVVILKIKPTVEDSKQDGKMAVMIRMNRLVKPFLCRRNQHLLHHCNVNPTHMRRREEQCKTKGASQYPSSFPRSSVLHPMTRKPIELNHLEGHLNSLTAPRGGEDRGVRRLPEES
ncbi:Nectin-1 [Anabarilius grahami]|uniref:Nectin-1 n=1 Tax=Anabarilius grahami TaxID=495550 RepID=A0A3N0Z9C6_ANAGA|nr:Nectin-1 [Anabarilius grahami]